jgi:putative transposase
MTVAHRREMIEASHPDLSIVRQCALLQISRSGHYHRPIGESQSTLEVMRLIDEAFLECPYYGSRQMMRHLHRLGHQVGRSRVVRLMRKMGLRAIYQKPNTSAPHPEHRIYPYLLRDLAIVRPNQVWCSDIRSSLPGRGFEHPALPVAAAMDRAFRTLGVRRAIRQHAAGPS